MNSRPITSEEILQSPSLAPWHDALMLVKTRSFEELFPRKYEMSIVNRAAKKTYKLFEEQPTMPIKEVLVSVLNSFTTELSGPILLKITQEIIERWGKLSQTVYQMDNEFETV
jgi:hypothetical protein